MKNRKTKFRFSVFNFYQQDGNRLCGLETKLSPKLGNALSDFDQLFEDKLSNIIAKDLEVYKQHKQSNTIDFFCSLSLLQYSPRAITRVGLRSACSNLKIEIHRH